MYGGGGYCAKIVQKIVWNMYTTFMTIWDLINSNATFGSLKAR